METKIQKNAGDNAKSQYGKVKTLIFRFLLPLLFSVLFFSANTTFAHCDTKDGPVVADARKAIEKNNVNYVLKWVQAATEKEIKEAFELTMKVRALSPDAKKLSDNYFFETLVRVHRSGEGVPYTGVKPSGTPIDEKILAADKSIELGNLSPLNYFVPKDKLEELKKRFDKVMSLKKFDINNVEAGREYIEAYVQFFKFAEGEEERHYHSHITKGSHSEHFPWILSGIFLLTTLLFGFLFVKKL